MPPQSKTDNPAPSLKEGLLAVFEQDSQIQVAVITELLSSKAKLFTMRGREVQLPFSRFDIIPGALPPEATSSETRSSFLLGARDEALERAIHFPTEELWTFVQEEPRDYLISSLTELYFGNNSLLDHLTLRFALYEDRVFFKRKKFSFIPRPSDTVEELQRAEEARVEKERQLEATLNEAMAASEKGKPIQIEQFSEPTQALFQKISEVAAAAPHIDNSQAKEVLHFLEHFEARAETSLKGNHEERAYQFLTRLGVFHKNTNLSFIRHQLPGPFDEGLKEAAAQTAERSIKAIAPNHEDCTSLHCMTIDDAETKDMDDALSLELVDGGYQIGIHIADVASLIEKNSLLDREARARATSLYFPEKTVHMFPEKISEELCSLWPHQQKATVSCFITFSSHHEILHSSLRLTIISVDEKQSYHEVDALLDPPSGTVGTLYEMAMSCEARRLANGGLKIPKREVEVCIEDPSRIATSDFSLRPYSEHTPARELIGEMMILANETMGTFAKDHDIPFVFRSQEAADGDSSRFLESLPPGPAYDAALRGTLKRSATNTTPAPHATLGLSCYAQATSPIRRYTDLINQRQLVAHLRGEPLPYSREEIEELLMELSQPLQRGRLMNRETHRFWILKYLKEKASKREDLEGTIVRDDGPQYQVELEEVFIPALLKTKEKLVRGDRVLLTVQAVDPRYDYLKLGYKKKLT